MKFLIKSSTLILMVFLSTCLFGQNTIVKNPEGTRYYAMDYMKVKPGMHSDYLALEKAWKKIHQHNIKEGKLVNWAIESVLYPNGANADYNYVTRMTFDSKKQLSAYVEKFPMPENVSSILTPEEMKLFNRTSEIRTFVKSEVWSAIDRVLTENMEEGKIVAFNYFDFPEGKRRADHTKIETDIWKPIHTARIKEGKMKGWVLLGMVFPFGASMPYHDATVDIYKSMEDYMKDSPMPYFEKIHPGKDVNKLLKETSDASTMVKGEVRMALDSTNKK